MIPRQYPTSFGSGSVGSNLWGSTRAFDAGKEEDENRTTVRASNFCQMMHSELFLTQFLFHTVLLHAELCSELVVFLFAFCTVFPCSLWNRCAAVNARS